MLLFGLTLLGAVAEIATLGALVPFLGILTNPEKTTEIPLLSALLGAYQRPVDRIYVLTGLFVAAALSAMLARIILLWATSRFAAAAGKDIGVNAYNKLIHQPYSFHIARNSSEHIALLHKISGLTSGVLLPVLHAATAAVILIFISGALLAFDPLTAAVAVVTTSLLYISLSYAVKRRLSAISETISAVQGKRVQSLQEGLGGVRDILLDGSQSLHTAKFSRLDDACQRARAMAGFIAGVPRFIVEAFAMITLSLLALALFLRDGGIAGSLPAMAALALGGQRMLPLVQQIYSAWSQLRGMHGVLGDVVLVLDLPLPPPPRPGEDLAPLNGDIRLESVSFRYAPAADLALENIDLTIRQGERIGIFGQTGSGKSTLVDLLLGLLSPSAGVIRVGGTALTTENLRNWQSQVAHVPQSIFLADGTIAENICFGADSQPEMARVERAARMAHISEFIGTLPEGYDTSVGERGVRLSGGQRQRIGIARALYRAPSVLILDEATSALDQDTEASIIDSIHALHSNVTVVMVAHRLSTLSRCDELIRIHRGQIIERGSATAILQVVHAR
jgi:ABC-type multidrug transport system fused ATPase/permease subunit